jgi:hypothetical protein
VETNRVVVADVALQLYSEGGFGKKGDAARELRLERVEERFRMGIVARAADVRALEHPVLLHPCTEGCPHVLRCTPSRDHCGR